MKKTTQVTFVAAVTLPICTYRKVMEITLLTFIAMAPGKVFAHWAVGLSTRGFAAFLGGWRGVPSRFSIFAAAVAFAFARAFALTFPGFAVFSAFPWRWRAWLLKVRVSGMIPWTFLACLQLGAFAM